MTTLYYFTFIKQLPTSLPDYLSVVSNILGLVSSESYRVSYPVTAGDVLLLLVCTSLQPSVLMPAAAMADQASFFFSLTVSLSFPRAGAAAGFRTGTSVGFGAGGLGFWARVFLVCWGVWVKGFGLGVCGFLALVTEAMMRSSISDIFFSILSSRIAM